MGEGHWWSTMDGRGDARVLLPLLLLLLLSLLPLLPPQVGTLSLELLTLARLTRNLTYARLSHRISRFLVNAQVQGRAGREARPGLLC